MILTSEEWNLSLKQFSDAHILQTAEWGDLKSNYSWKPVRFSEGGCYAQILFRRLPGGFSIGYIPKGPLGRDSKEFWLELIKIGNHNRAIMIKIEPDDLFTETSQLNTPMDIGNFVSSRPIQPAQTIVLDINGDERTILDRMKQKTRYNIHLAEKKGISVQVSNDIRSFHQMMITTGSRDGFGTHSYDYYQKAYDLFSTRGKCVLLKAGYGNVDLAAVMLFCNGRRCWYFYGASTDIERNRMPVYLLQWEAIRWAKAQGCEYYDLWGIPDAPEFVLEDEFSTRSDGLWGVYRFKRGFGGKIVKTPESMDLILQPQMYKMLMWWLKFRNRGVEIG